MEPPSTGNVIWDFKDWLQANRPELAKELGPMSYAQANDRLNLETGLNILGTDPLTDGFAKHLEALKAKHSKS